MLLPFIDPNDPASVRRAFQKINHQLGVGSKPTFAGLYLTDLTTNSLVYSASGGAMTSLGAATDGQIPIGSTGAVPTLATITGTADEIDITNGAGSITIGLVNPLAVAKGGTGRATSTTAYGLIAAGTTATGALQTLPAGLTTQILVGGGTDALPAWGTDIPTAVTIGAAYIYRAGGTDVPVADGGTGVSTLTDHSILLGSGAGAVTALGEATNGQLPIGSTGADPVLAAITGTANQVTVTNGAGSITLSTPQNIHATADVEFRSLLIDQDTDAVGLNIDSEATTDTNYGLQCVTGAGAIAALFSYGAVDNGSFYVGCPNNQGYSGNFVFARDLAAANTDGSVVYIHQDNAGDDQPCLELQQDGSGHALLTNGNIRCDGDMTVTGTTTYEGNIIIPDAGYIGSASDTDAIQIEADGDVVVSQMLAVTGDIQVTGNILFMADRGGLGYSDNSPMIVFDDTNNRVEFTGNIMMADDATIGVSDGSPSILFDDTDDQVEVTGGLTVTGYVYSDSNIVADGFVGAGVADTTQGQLIAYQGGQLYLRIHADHDDTINDYILQASEDDLLIGSNSDTDIIKITAGNAVSVTTTLSVTGAITAANYTAANLLTACATNAGALDFSAASKTLTVEDNTIVSQDYSSDASPTFAGLDLTGLTDSYVPYVSASGLADSPLYDAGSNNWKFNGAAAAGFWTFWIQNTDTSGVGRLLAHNGAAAMSFESVGQNYSGAGSSSGDVREAGSAVFLGSNPRANFCCSGGGLNFYTGGALAANKRIAISNAGVTSIGDGGTTNYAQFSAAGSLSFAGSARLDLSWITDGNVPYISASGFVDGPISTDGTHVIIGNASAYKVKDGSGVARTMLQMSGNDTYIGQAGVSGDTFIGTYSKQQALTLLHSNGYLGLNETAPITALEITNTSPHVTLHNSTHQDADGGRSCRIYARGEQSGGEETILGWLEFSHDGVADDEKGRLQVKVNDGNDGTSPSITGLTIRADGGVETPNLPSGATQVAAGAAAGELWSTSGHASLPDNVVMIGV